MWDALEQDDAEQDERLVLSVEQVRGALVQARVPVQMEHAPVRGVRRQGWPECTFSHLLANEWEELEKVGHGCCWAPHEA